ncbi:hypothetical protein K438DRAFT_2043748 [Mycena galopus ATCC 62051]|nr:hypothetical protein K438DRAFT_2043748 [Mycena galopus ATCC 62051]
MTPKKCVIHNMAIGNVEQWWALFLGGIQFGALQWHHQYMRNSVAVLSWRGVWNSYAIVLCCGILIYMRRHQGKFLEFLDAHIDPQYIANQVLGNMIIPNSARPTVTAWAISATRAYCAPKQISSDKMCVERVEVIQERTTQ